MSQYVLDASDVPTLKRLSTLAERMVPSLTKEPALRAHNAWLKDLCDALVRDLEPKP